MKKLVLIFSLLFCAETFAQADLSGTWQGKLTMSPNEKITIQFIITKQADGSYKAVLNSPDTGGIKNVPASSVKYAAGKLTVDVASLSGSYSGTVEKGAITGEWKQPGSTLPLVLAPYKKPEVGTLKPLLGEWFGELQLPGSTKMTMIFRFEMTKDGKFAGLMDIPDQGAKDVPVADVLLDGGQVSLKIAGGQADYTGKLSGNTIVGTVKQGAQEFKLDLTRGKYEPPSADANLTPEAKKQLLGQWVGKWTPPGSDPVTVIFRFETTKEGKFRAVTSSPEQGASELDLADVSLKGDEVGFKIPGARGEYSGKLKGDTISGIYRVNGGMFPITITKGAKYDPPVALIDIPAETMKQMSGRWSGKLAGALTIAFRFERAANGKNTIFMDVPEQGAKAVPVLKASLVNDTLSLKIAGAEYSGKLSGNKIDGSWSQNNQKIPLLLTKEQAVK
jgi:hypothetical protein